MIVQCIWRERPGMSKLDARLRMILRKDERKRFLPDSVRMAHRWPAVFESCTRTSWSVVPYSDCEWFTVHDHHCTWCCMIDALLKPEPGASWPWRNDHWHQRLWNFLLVNTVLNIYILPVYTVPPPVYHHDVHNIDRFVFGGIRTTLETSPLGYHECMWI